MNGGPPHADGQPPAKKPRRQPGGSGGASATAATAAAPAAGEPVTSAIEHGERSRSKILGRVFLACDRDTGGTVGADEFQKLQHELGEHLVADSPRRQQQLVRSFSATERDKSGAVDLAELTAALEAVPAAALEWWAGRTERGEVEIVPTAPRGAPVVIGAAVGRRLPTIRGHVEETGVGVRFEAPFDHAQVTHLVDIMSRAVVAEDEDREDEKDNEDDGPVGELLAAARLTVQVATGIMEFMQVEPTPALTREIAGATKRLLAAEEDAKLLTQLLGATKRLLAAEDDAELLTQLLGRTAFAKGVLAELPKDGVKMRVLLLDESVRAAENPDGDGSALNLVGYRLEHGYSTYRRRVGVGLEGYWLKDADRQALLATLHSEQCKLTKLNLHGLWLGSQYGFAIAAALQLEHCKLTKLDLCYNKLGAEAGLAIAVALQSEHCKLTYLDLCYNNLGVEAGLAIAVALQSEHCKLTYLDLGGNGLGMEGGLAIAVALQSEHCKLTDLDLWNNELGEESGLAIAVALQSEHCKLTDLNLESNKLGAEARLAITAALPSANV